MGQEYTECAWVRGHSVPETPSYGTELTLGAQNSLLRYAKRKPSVLKTGFYGTEGIFGARKDLDNYSEKNYTFVKILYSGVRSLYDFWKADNKF